MSYKVFAALSEDINSGWCWISGSHVKNRTLVRITNRDNKKFIICEALAVDSNYKKKYLDGDTYNSTFNGEKIIIINSWYRNILGIEETKTNYDLYVETVYKYDAISHLRACFTHPQIAIRLGTYLGILGVIVGCFSLISNDLDKLFAVYAIGYFIGKSQISSAWKK